MDKKDALLYRLAKIRMRAGMEYDTYYNTITDVMNILYYTYDDEITVLLSLPKKYDPYSNQSSPGG